MKTQLLCRILLLVCGFALVLSCAACVQEEPGTSPQVQLLDEHQVIITDIGTGRIIVTDLDAQNPLSQENLIWEWTPGEELGWNETTRESLIDSLSAVKYRWSAYYQTNVVLFANARGTAGMIEYPSGKCLWEAKMGNSPHSIELLPNGDIVVASSGGGAWEEGRLYYYRQQEDGTYAAPTQRMLNGAHGVLWDPDNQVLWALGFEELVAYCPGADSAGDTILYLVEGWGADVPNGTGHDLMPDYSNRDILWLTDDVSVVQFSKYKNEIVTEFANAEKFTKMPTVKGVTSFSDGVVAFVSYGDVVGSGHPAVIRSYWPNQDGTFELVKYTDSASGWNKIRVFTSDYQ